MSIQDENKNDANSKIEQIRIDLEKKLSAIEKSKNDISNKVDDKEVEIINKTESNPVFEISAPITPVIEEVKEVSEIEKTEVEEIKEVEILKTTEKEISKTELINEEVNASKTSNNSSKTTVIQPPQTIISSISKENTDEIENKIIVEEPKEEEKSKKGLLSFIIYGLLIALFAAIGYMVVDYMKQNNELVNEKMEQKLSEFKNKRYLDSVELADLNTQLEDIQTKKMLDSLDRLNEMLLLRDINKKSNKTKTQRNFNLLNENRGNVDLSASNTITNNIEKNGKSIADTKNISSKENIVDLANNSVSKNLKNSNLSEKESSKKDDVALNTDTNNSDNPDKEAKKEVIDTDSSSSNKDLASIPKKVDSKTNDESTVKVKIRKVPVYPGCEKKITELDKKKCLSSKMYKHILRKFNSDVANNSGLKAGIHEVRVSYIIDRAGYATVLNVRGESKELETEAIRVIQSLPKMVPGTINGKRSKTLYNIPIKFNVQN